MNLLRLKNIPPIASRTAYLAWVVACFFCFESISSAQLFWDTNGVSIGSADSILGVWGIDNFWNTDSTGGAGGAFQISTLLTDDLTISAGSNATGTNLITLSGSQQAQSLTFSNGTVTLAGTASPSLTLGSGGLTMSNTLDGPLTLGATLGSVILSGNQTWSNHSSQTLTVSAPVSGSAGGGGTHTLTVGGTGSGAVSIGGVLADGSGGGVLALSKGGAFLVTLSGVNTYTGATNVTAGTLRAGVATKAFGVNSAVTLSDTAGAVLSLAGFNNTIGSLAGGGASGGDVVLGAGTLTAGGDGTSTTFGGIISGAGGLTKKGAGTFTLSGVNLYTGPTAVTAGVLRAGVVTRAFGVNSAVTLSNVASAGLDLNGFDNTIGSLAGGGVLGGNVALGAGVLTVGGDGTSTSYAGVISGGGGVTKVGAGTLRLTGVGTYTGVTTITAGVLQLGDGVTDGAIATSSGIVNNAGLVVNVLGGQDYGVGISGTGTFTKLGAGTFTLSGNNSYTGLTTIGGGTLVLGSANALNGGGNIVFSGGTLQFSAGNTQDYGAKIVSSASAMLLDTNGNDVVFNGVLNATNTGGLTKLGAGVLTVGGANAYSGATTVTSGTLKAGVITSAFGNNSAVTLGNNVDVLLDLNGFDNTIGSLAGGGTTGGSVSLGGGTLTLGGNATSTTYSGVISGAGGITKLGAGTLTLTGTQIYTGVTTVSAGSLQIGNGVTDGFILTTSGVVNNASLIVNNIGQQTDAFGISGAGVLLKKGAGILTLTGSNSFTGVTTLNGGTLNLGSANALGGGGSITFSGGTLQFSASNTTDYSAKIVNSTSRIGLDTNGQDMSFNGVLAASNAGGLSKLGAGTLTLSGVNLYTGATDVIGGILMAGVATSAFGNNSAVTLSNVAGVFLDISGFSTTIGSLAGGGTTGGTVVLGASTLTLGGANTSTTFSGVITGSGGVTKVGTGTQTLSGSNTYTGPTTVTAGSLKAGIVNNAFGNNSAVTLSNVAGVFLDITGFSNTIGSLSGGGATGGNVILGAATLTVGTLGTSTTYSGGISGTGNLVKTGTGALTLSKANTYTGATSVTGGSLIAGVLTNAFGSNSALTLGNVADVYVDITGFSTTIGSLAGGGTSGGTVLLGSSTLTMGGANTSTTFSGVITGSGGISKGGTGIQTLSGSNTYTGATAITAGSLKAGIANNAFGVNSAVTLSNVAGVFLDISGFDTTIGSLSGAGATGGNVILGSATLTVGTLGTSTTYSGGISGGGNLVKTGTGTLTLSKANTYSGITSVTGGSLKAGVITTAFGSNSAVILSDTAGVFLDITGFSNTIGSLAGGGTNGGTVVLGAATLTMGGANTSTTFSGVITGAGGISKGGTGIQTLSGSNTYTGATAITAGSLKAGIANNAFGVNSAVTLSNVAGVFLDITGFDTTLGSLAGAGTTGGTVILGASTLTLGGDGTSTTFSGVVSGAGALTKAGSGTFIVTGTQAYTGLTTISGGTLQVGNGTTNGLITSSSGVLNNSALIFNLLGSQTDAFVISGSGSFAKTGTGTLVLSGANTYSGVTTMGSGVLSLGNTNALGGGGSLKFTGGTLQFTASNTSDYSLRVMNSTSAITLDTNGESVVMGSSLASSNTGGLTKLGAGILTISGSNAYTGATTVLAGTLRAGGGSNAFGSSATLTLSNVAGVSVDLGGYDNTIGALAGGGSLGGSVILGGATLTSGGNGSSTAYAGTIVGPGSFTKTGTGTQTLTGTATYTGLTLISGGTLQIGDGTTDGSITSSGSITNNATLTFNLLGTQTDSVGISGTGSLMKTGFGVLVLSGSNSYSGLTIIGSGTLSLGSVNALAGGGGITFRGGTLQFSGSNTEDYGARIIQSTSALLLDTNGQNVTFAGGLASSNTAGLTKVGSGILTLSGSNLYTGTSTVSAGTLRAGATTNAFGSNSAVSLGNVAGATLDLAGFSNTIGSLAGGGTSGGNVTLGVGTLTVGGDGTSTTYAGVISGSGGIVKVGTGVQTLSGTNLYTGATGVSAGTLRAGAGTSAFGSGSAVSLGNVAGATLDLGGFSNTIGSLAGGGTLGGNVTLGVGTLTVGGDGTSTTYAGVVSGSGGITKTGAGELTLSGSNLYTGTSTVSAGTLRAGAGTNAFGANSAVSLGNVAGATLDLGGFSNTIGSLSGGGTLGGNVMLGVGTLTVGGNGTSTTYAGVISGAGGIAKTGAGVQTLTGSNLYTGQTSVSAGTLRAGLATNAFGANSAVSLGNVAGATLDLAGFSNTIGSLAGGGTLGGNVTLGAGTLTVGGDGTSTTYAGVISGSGGIVKMGTGVQTLSGTNTYTGATSVSAGTLRAGAGTSAFGSGSAVTLNDVAGLTLDLGGFSNTIGSLAGGGTLGGNVTLGAGTLTVGGDGTSTTYAGVISGAGGITKTGAGVQTLTGSNLYTGQTSVAGGTLRAGLATSAFGANSAVSLGNVAGATLDLGGFSNTIGSLAGGGTLGGNVTLGVGTLTVGGDGTSTTYAGVISGAGGITKTGAGVQTLSGTNLYTGTTTVSAGTLRAGAGTSAFGSGSAVTLNDVAGLTLDLGGFSNTIGSLAGGGTLGGNVTLGAGTLTVGGDGTSTTYAGVIFGSGGIVKVGTGVQTLSGTNLYTGTTTVSAGTLRAGLATSAFGANSAVSLGNVAGATLDLAGFSNTIGSLAGGGTLGGNVTLGAGTLTVGGNGTATTYAGVISGAGGITKTGAGVQTLTGSNLYTGQTSVAGGTLRAGLATNAFGANSAVSLGNVAGATLDLAGFSNTIGSLAGGGTSGGNVTLGVGTLTVGGDGTSTTYAGVISGSGGIVKMGTGVQTLSGTNTYTGATSVSAGTLRAGAGTSTFGASSAVTLNDVAGATLDLAGFSNTIGSLAGGGAIGGNVTLGVGTLTVGGDGTSTTYAGVISGAGGITKTGAGVLTLTGSNLYTGQTSVSVGTLRAGLATSAFGSNSAVSLGNVAGATLDLAGFSNTIGSLAGGGTSGGNVTLGVGTLTVGGDGTSATYAGVISGAGGITKTGAGVQTLSGTNTYTGQTSVSAGTLRAGAGTNAFGANSAVSLGNVAGATLDLGGFSNTIGSLAGGGTIGGNVTLGVGTLTVGGDGTSTTYAGVVSGSGGITKTGAGVLTLLGSNLYTGASTVNAGTLRAGAGTSAFGANSAVNLGNVAGATLDLAGFSNTIGSLAGGGAIGGNVTLGVGTLTVGGDGTSTTYAGVISGAGGIAKTGAGVQTLTASNTYTRTTTVSAGTLRAGAGTSAFGANSAVSLGNVAGATLDLAGFSNTIGSLAGGGTLGGNVTLGVGTLTVGGDGTSATYAGVISGSGGIVKMGTGVQTLTGSNLYTGQTSVSAGTLRAGAGTSAFGSGSAVSLGNVAGATLDLAGFSNTIGSLAGGGTLGGNVTLGVGTLTVGGDGTSTTYAGVISGAGGIAKTGAGVQTLSGTNTYTGQTSVSAGTLRAGLATSAFGSGSAVSLGNVAGATLDLAGFSNTIGSLAGGGTSGGNVTLGVGTLTVGGDGTSTTYAGVISGSGGIVKVGTGVQTLSGTNTYTGATSVSAGTLRAGAGTSAFGSGSAVTLNDVAGATLDLAGFSNTIGSLAGGGTSGGNVTLGVGTLTVGGDGTSTTYAGVVSGAGGITKTGAGVLTLSGASMYTGATSVVGGTLRAGVSTAAFGNYSAVTLSDVAGVTLDLAGFNNTIGSLAGGGAIGGNVTLGLASLSVGGDGTNATYAGVISGVGGLIKGGTGTQTLTGLSTYTGATTVSAGTLSAGVTSTAFGVNSAVTLNNAAGATLDLGGFSNTIGSLAGGGTSGGNVRLGGGTLTLGGDGTSTTYAGVISGAGGLVKIGAGMQTLSGLSTYTGATTVTAGTLSAGVTSTAFGVNSVVTLNNAAGATLDLGGFSNTIGSLAGGGTLGGNVTLGAGTLTLGGDGTSTTFAGVISGAGGIVKTGAGTQTLTGTNLYTGTTVVNGGSLVAGSAGAFAGLGGLTVNTGMLDVSGQSMTVGSILQNGGSLTLATGRLVTVTGNATLSGVINVTGTLDAANVGRYMLLTAGGLLGGSFTTGLLPDSVNYYLNINGTSLELQRRSTVGTVTATPVATSIITGGSTAVSVSIFNQAPLLSGSLSATATTSGSLTGSGSVSGIAPQTSSPISGIYFTGTTVGALQTGTVSVTGASASNATVDTTVSVNVYDHASTTFSGGTVHFGNMREGYSSAVVGLNSLSVTNEAGYRVALMGSAAGAGGITLSSLSGLAAASSDVITGTLSTGNTAGLLNRNFTYTFADDSALNGASVNVGTATVQVDGAVYRSAIGTLEQSGVVVSSGGTLTQAAVRVGDTFAALALDVRNTATSGDAFSEKLNATVLSGNGTGMVSLLAAGSLQSGGISVSVPAGQTSSVGVKTGSVVVGFQTDGTGTSGLAALAVTSGTVNLTGTVYRKAVGGLTSGTITLGAVRENGAFTAQNLTVRNLAGSDGFSDDLAATISTASGGVSVSGTALRISAGSQNSSSLQLNYTGSTAAAGVVVGTAAVSYTSKGQVGTGLADIAADVAGETVSLSGTIYRLAVGSLSSGTLSLGNIRTGSAFGSGTVMLTNSAANDGFSDLLKVEQVSSANGFVVLGGSQTLAAAQAGTFSIGLLSSPTAIGVTSGSVTFGLTSVGQTGTGLSDVALTSQSLNLVVTGSVYRAGSGVLASNSVTLASIRESDVFVSTALNLTNGATNDGFSEKLNAAFGTMSGSATSSGTAQLIAAGSFNTTGLLVGLTNNGSAGVKSGNVNVLFETDGNGTSGLAAESVGSGTVAVSGTVYRKAVGSVSSGTLNLAAVREGELFVAKNVRVTNMASGDGFSDDLGVAISVTGSGFVASGSAGRVSAGTMDSSSLSVNYTGSTALAGAVSGTATLAYMSKGQVGTGLVDVAADTASETVAVRGNIYRLASGSLSAGSISLGNIRVGSAFGAASVTVTNTAVNDGFSDLLRVAQTGALGGFTILGGTQTLSAAGTGTFSIGLAPSPGAIGTTGGTVSFGLTSVGQAGSGLSDVALAAQTLNVVVSGNVYRMGSGVLSANSLTLASVREGEVFVSQTLGVSNGAATDGFSEKLNASFGTMSGSALSSGSVQLLAAGSSDLVSLAVGLTNAGTAGVKSGSVNVLFETDGNGTSGIAGEAVGSGTVSVSGNVYRKAVGSVLGGSVQLAAVREGGLFAAKNVTVANTAGSDGFSDDLAAAISTTSVGFVVSGSAGRVSAGTQNSTGMAVNYTGSTASAGVVSGSAALAYTSKGQVGTGLSDVTPTVSGGSVAVSGTIYRLAQGALSTGTLNLGNIRTGSAFGSGSVTVTNTAANDGFSDLLRVGQAGNVSQFTILGGTQTLAAAGTGTFSIGFAASSQAAGITSGTLSFGLTSVGQTGTGLADIALANQTLLVTGTVYRAGSGVIGANQITLASVREGDVFAAKGLQVSNGSTADGFSEKLNVAPGTLTGGALASGTVSLLAAGSSDLASIRVGLTHNGSAGLKSGAVTVLFETDGTGTSALAAESVGSGTVSVIGSVYRKAIGGLSSGTIDLGAIRENETFTAKTLTARNTASVDGFSDDLGVNAGGASSGFSVSGSAARISAGSQNSTALAVNYTGSTAAAGAVSGTATVAYTSKGQVGTGLLDVAAEQATGSVAVSGNIYRLAQGSLSSGSISLGNIRAGSVFGSGTVGITNSAANDGFSDLLRVTQTGDTGGFTAIGGTQTLSAAGTGLFSVALRASEAAVGTTSGSVIFGLTSVGQTGTGLADVALPSQTLTVLVSGSVYRAGSGVLASSQVTLDSIREGDAFAAKTLTVSNGAVADGFSEKLNVSFGSVTGGGLASGSRSLLAAGATDSASLQVGLSNSGTAGVKQGTVRVLFETDGSGTSGIAAESVGSGTVAVSGNVYRKAVGTLGSGTLDLGATREGGGFTARAVTVRNTASADGYSDDLEAVISSLGAGISTSGTVGRISAGSQNSTDLLVNYSGSTAVAGAVSGTAGVTYISKGQVGTGLSDVSPDHLSDSVAVSGSVYRLAQGTLNSSELDLGRIHAGQVASLTSVQLSHTGVSDGYSDLLRVSPLSDASGFLLGGTVETLVAGGSVGYGVGYNLAANTSGLVSGTLTFGLTSVGQAGTGLGDVTLSSKSVNVTAQVYTGLGVWNGSGSGSWDDFNNWATSGGRPGLDGVLSRGVDSATFNSGTPLSVQMPAQLVELAKLELLGAGGVQLARPVGGGGGISLSGTAQITASGGQYLVEVPLTLASTATITVEQGAKLTLGGVIGGSGNLLKQGNGTLLFTAANTYTGATAINAGRLEIGVGALPGRGTITLGEGAVLAFYLTSDLILPNTIVGGAVVSLNAPYRVFWNGGSTAAYGTGVVRVGSGEVLDFSADSLREGEVLSINAGTLQVRPMRTLAVRNLVTMETSADFAIQEQSTLTLSGNISGDGVLRKQAAGTLVLEGENTYFGGTEVMAGTLEIRNGTALGTAGVRIDASGELQVNVTGTNAITVANSITGPGELIKVGAGTLQLTGTNTQELGTRLRGGFLEVLGAESVGKRLTLDGGTLVLGGTTSLTQAVSFASASVVSVGSGAAAELGGTLSGDGGFTKTGSGSLLLSGSGSLAGRAVVQAGTLKVTRANTLSGVSTLVVGNSGANQTTTILDVTGLAGGLQLGVGQSLMGRSVLRGEVGLTGATLKPGNSIDVLHVQGGLTLTNSEYEVEYSFVDGGTSDLIAVTGGSLTLNGGSVVLTAMARGQTGTRRFTIATADGGVNGRFAGVAPSAVVQSRLIYGDEAAVVPGPVLSIAVEVQRSTYASVGGVGNLREVGRGLDLISVAPSLAFGSLLGAIDGIETVEGVREVYTQLNPVIFAELYHVSLLRLEDVQKPISDRLNQLGAASVSGRRDGVLSASVGGRSEWSAWTNAFAGIGNVERDSGAGFAGLSRREGGDVTGVERRIGRLTLGFVGATSFGGASMSGPGASVRSDSWHVGPYVSLPLSGRVFADVSGFYGDVSSVVKRPQQLPTGTVQSQTNVHGNEWLLQTGVGMQLAAPTSSWSLLPSVRLAYAGVHQGGVKETGAGLFGVQTDGMSSGTVLFKSAVEGAKEWRWMGHPMRVSGSLEWLHDFDVDPRKTGVRWQTEPGAPWSLSGAAGKADGVNLGLALDIGLTDRRTLRLYGEREFLKSGEAAHFGFAFNVGF